MQHRCTKTTTASWSDGVTDNRRRAVDVYFAIGMFGHELVCIDGCGPWGDRCPIDHRVGGGAERMCACV